MERRVNKGYEKQMYRENGRGGGASKGAPAGKTKAVTKMENCTGRQWALSLHTGMSPRQHWPGPQGKRWMEEGWQIREAGQCPGYPLTTWEQEVLFLCPDLAASPKKHDMVTKNHQTIAKEDHERENLQMKRKKYS